MNIWINLEFSVCVLNLCPEGICVNNTSGAQVCVTSIQTTATSTTSTSTTSTTPSMFASTLFENLEKYWKYMIIYHPSNHLALGPEIFAPWCIHIENCMYVMHLILFYPQHQRCRREWIYLGRYYSKSRQTFAPYHACHRTHLPKCSFVLYSTERTCQPVQSLAGVHWWTNVRRVIRAEKPANFNMIDAKMYQTNYCIIFLSETQ